MKNLSLLILLIAGLTAIPLGQVRAQTLTTLHNFSGDDGSTPYAGLVLLDNALYGTAYQGGPSNYGTVFKVNIDGTDFTYLHRFAGHDGAHPYAKLVASSNVLYGTTHEGVSSAGTVFRINTNGTGFTTLHYFTGSYPPTNSDGASPYGGLILSSNILYGTTQYGGSFFNGMVFAVNTDGTGFTNVHSFAATILSTNSFGAYPLAGLVKSNNTLYGTTAGGGSTGNGTVFKVNTDGTGFTNLHIFANTDGNGPRASLVLSGNTLFGTAVNGGNPGNGTIFAVNTDGTAFTNLYHFSETFGRPETNYDGAILYAGLTLSGNTLYGAAAFGGGAANGTVFSLKTNGTGFTRLHSFSPDSGAPSTSSDGANPIGDLVVSGNTLYGTANRAGTFFGGTVFKLKLLPQLTINLSGASVVLSWPTNETGFVLRSTTNLVPPTVWNNNLTAPVVVNGYYTVTNHVSGASTFYRLNQ